MAWWDKLLPGIRVVTTARALAVETFEFATILGGEVLIVQLIGRITVIVNAATNVLVQHTSDVGTAGVTPLSVPGNVNGLDVGDGVGITGVPTDALLVAVTAGVPGMVQPYILPAGGIESVSDAAPGTGTIQWFVWYVPLVPGAYVTGV